MNCKLLFVLVLLSLLLAGFNLPGDYPQVVNLTPAAVEQNLDGELIPINPYSYSSLGESAAAYSTRTGQYLVLWEGDTEGSIKYKYIDGTTGETLGPSHQYLLEEDGYNPDVVYDKLYDRFLVVWDELNCLGIPAKCYYVIKGRLMRGRYQDGNVYAGDALTIASEHSTSTAGYDLREPAAAYNETDHQYVIVYRYGRESAGAYYSIYGQMLGAGEKQPQELTDPFSGFEIRTYPSEVEVVKPDVTWSQDGGTFLAVWQKYHETNTDEIVGRYLYDYYRSGFGQVYGDGATKLAPYNEGPDPLTYDCSFPSIAYDRSNKNYVVVFEYKGGTDFASPFSVYAQRLKGAYDPTSKRINYAFSVEAADSQAEYQVRPEIVYSGLEADMYVVYISWDFNDPGPDFYRVFERTLRAAEVMPRLKIREGKGDISMDDPVIAGTDDGRALVVWDETNPTYGGAARDIFGQRIKPPGLITLPIVIKE
jgi:hypothetical protein